MCREVLELTGDHIDKEPAGATVYAGGFGCLVSDSFIPLCSCTCMCYTTKT